MIVPNLTTVDQPGERIGRTAVDYLIDEIDHPNDALITKTIEIKTNLIVRDSSFKG
ncbi:substrate-binding domain-containing protein [Cellulophaga tyrosinoxydans]|uniref:substrate-binding domain-containing protein n=1 Tax=Cellulophaga tyrosinoxydans TaxID=504486 RepID=UPI00293701BC|nr:substrate-binding domain-containing protein [Cellulophaga tyrosinoxydans]